ncbi:MAG: hypothetical protein ACC628_16060 [Pirellulaceae bacterium]
MSRRAILWSMLLLLGAERSRAGEIGYLEDFALAGDRDSSLQTLIPGSEEYYYYHCMHYQNRRQFDKVEPLLKLWGDRYKDSGRLRVIRNRQALLSYEADPAGVLEYLRQRLELRFDHQREALGAKPNLPIRLDPALIRRERLTERAMRRHQNLEGFEDSALDWLVVRELNREQRRHLLERLVRPDHPKLAELVVADLNDRTSKPFGSFKIHGQLLRDQLDELARLKPELKNQTPYVNAYLTKLHPGADSDWQQDAVERKAYLDRLWSFVQPLAPAHNSLKAHVLYRRLAFDRSQGTYDKGLFVTYLRLPRNVAYIEPKFLQMDEGRRFPADLNARFEPVTLMDPVRNDEPLVRSYLQHFFLKETSTKPYEPYVQDDYLRELFAETKIVNGLGEPEQWYSLLPPEKYQSLKQRVDLDFAFSNPESFAANAPVQFDMFVKNVRTLIVKVFEVNTENFYRERKRDVNTDIPLDGLVANDEQVHKYTDSPLRRVRRHFEFPALKKPGVYVVDFIGNGKSSRVVVRKGKLRHLVRTSTAGHVFTVFDELDQPVRDARLWLSGHEYVADEEGRILVPFTTKPGRQKIVLSTGSFSSLGEFQHQSESYQLAAGIHVDRESLLQGRTATVLVRPALSLNGTPVTLSVLEDVHLQITSVDHDGVSTTKEVKDFELFENREADHEFQTPPRLAEIAFTLRAKVQNISQNKKVDLAVSKHFKLNAMDKTEKIEALHFARVGDEYVLELLGKTGEAKPDRPVRLTLKHRDFRETVQVPLQSDEAGRIYLGKLEDIASVTAHGPDDISSTWWLLHDQHTYPRSLHGVAGEPLELPYMGAREKPSRDDLSLLERRANTFVADRFEALSIHQGMLRIQELPPGDYDLLIKESGRRIQVRIAEGDRRNGYVMGDHRHLELRGQEPLQIAAIEPGEDAIYVRLRNASPFSRVHVFATRYYPAYSVFSNLGRVADAEPLTVPLAGTRSLYAAGRMIGDEYRYIIDRKYASKFPGNLLERPSLLLNPWPLRSTETDRQKAAQGEDFAAEPEAAPAESLSSAQGGKVARERRSEFANLDFLAEASTVLLNQKPNEQGVVAIPRAVLRPHQYLHVIAVDPVSTAYRSIGLEEQEARFLDMRLADGLDPAQSFMQQKRISIVPAGETLVIPNITTSRVEMFDDLARVYSLFVTLSGDARLAEFGFILNWPKMTVEAKRKTYSKYACHELNFFLFKKDPAFFEEVVLPFLHNKLHKTFFDHWLIGAPLDDFLSPWHYDRLNIVERILLSQRLADDRPHTRQHVAHLFELVPPDIDRFNHLFLTALQGRALDTGERLDMDGRVRKKNMLGLLPQAKEAPALRAGKGDAAPPVPPAELAAKKMLKRRAAVPHREAKGERASRSEELGRMSETDARGNRAAGQTLDFFLDDSALRRRSRRLYDVLDKTREWAENNYYQRPIESQNAQLVTVNGFWNDYARQDPQQPFLSVHFADASRDFTEMMLVLALLDLPFHPAEHKSKIDETRMTLTPGSSMIVFHEEIRETKIQENATPILVSQNFFRHGDRYYHEHGERRDKFVTDEFLVHTVYGCQVVVTNPTSSPQKLDVLLQIPRGALPVLNARRTRSVHIDLQPYHTQTMEYHFYFPAAGQQLHYPVHVARNEELLAHAEPVTLAVVEIPSRVDRTSWQYISQYGTSEEVLEYLRHQNLHRIDLEKIAFRMSERAFFQSVVDLLSRRHAYHHTLWSYGIRHDEVPAIQEFLQHSDEFVAQCGPHISSPLLSVDPVQRHTYQHLDYRPLVNARAHSLGTRRQILNERLHSQYHRLLDILSCKAQLDNEDLLAVTYYLLLQDRVGEALDFFQRVEAATLVTRLQYDYFAAYLAIYREDLDVAREAVARYKDHPVDHWRDLFAAMGQQLREIDGADVEVLDPENRDQTQTELAASEPGFDFQVEAKKVRIDYQNLEQVRVQYYLMDIELLFSRNPFVQQYSSQFSHIRPNLAQDVSLPGDANAFEFPLPEELHNRNVLVEIRGAGQATSQAYYSNSLALQVIENYGQVRVTEKTSGGPLSRVYVKVYARMRDGSVRFYKDGYTDLRGRFDYASLNTNELDSVDRFALLVLSDQHGASVREAGPPKR